MKDRLFVRNFALLLVAVSLCSINAPLSAATETTTDLQPLFAAVDQRKTTSLELDAKEVSQATTAINEFIACDHLQIRLNDSEKNAIAAELLRAIAFFPEPNAADKRTNDVLAIVQTLLYKHPGKLMQCALESLRDGSFHPAGASDRTVSVNLSALPSAGDAGMFVPALFKEIALATLDGPRERIDTPQLQAMYDLLAGSEKGAFVLKNGSPFLLVDANGRFRVFLNDTNYLSWNFQIDDTNLQLQSAGSKASAGYVGTFRLVPSPAAKSDIDVMPACMLDQGRVVQNIQLTNTTGETKNFTLRTNIQHDFADMFEIRGWKRANHGEQLPFEALDERKLLHWSYKGLDGRVMTCELQTFGGSSPSLASADKIEWPVTVPPHQTREVLLAITPEWQAAPSMAQGNPSEDFRKWKAAQVSITSDDPRVNHVIEQAYKDIYLLLQTTPRGNAIAAGLPWFACAFGRDDLITSLQTMMIMPSLTRNVLITLANYQGTKDDATTAEKPGKIMHELRVGEMARNHEIPFAPYYGTVDATPLWLMVLGRYVAQTGDRALVEQLRPNIESALAYLDAEVQRGNGYLTYGGNGKEALSNQGWKDSGDSVFYSNGKLATAPIALAEVQGYLFDAWQRGATMYELLGESLRAQALQTKAADLQRRFQKDFWMPDKNFVAEALDGAGKQVDIVTSNPGQLLFTGLLTDEQNRIVAKRLMSDDMFSGFGIRTLATNQARYFSNSYHDGSIWPHDNSIIGAGLASVDPKSANKLFSAMCDVATHDPDSRLPELFGGYPRDHFDVPIPYSVACKPQAWAAGAPFLLLCSQLGIHINGSKNELSFSGGSLPQSIHKLILSGLQVGYKRVNVVITNTDGKLTGSVFP